MSLPAFMYDVIVVGAGPGGSAAARNALSMAAKSLCWRRVDDRGIKYVADG